MRFLFLLLMAGCTACPSKDVPVREVSSSDCSSFKCDEVGTCACGK